ncbi:MAG: pyridoxal-dependent decarboxylase [Planctomycetota bacterium]
MPDAQGPNHVNPEEFRRLAHRLIDEIADYYGALETNTVRPDARPGDLLAKLPPSPPDTASEAEWDAIFDDLRELIIPSLTHWQHPGFFAYFPCNASGPAILAELLSAALNVNGMLWATSPAVTELETRMLDWCAELFGLPDEFRTQGDEPRGCIQGTASEATLVALLAARQRLRAKGIDGPLAIYTSTQAHSSVAKAAMIAGIASGPDDTKHVRLVDTDTDGAMNPEHLAWLIAEDAAGNARPTPAAVVATCGTTGLGAFDPIPAIADAIKERAWLHIDAAWAGPAAACPEHRAILDGVDRADSLCINPHKWMLTNFDCDLFWTTDPKTLVKALSITPEYLRNAATDTGVATDYRDWGVPLGRRFRALKLWFVLRHYGVEGVRAHVRQHVEWAKWLESKLSTDPRFELAAPRSLSLVTFRRNAGDDATRELMERLNATGDFLLSHTTHRIDGTQRYVIRVAIGATTTERRHVEALWSAIDDATLPTGSS